MTADLDPELVKKQSEQIVLAAGGKICEWLPHIEQKDLRPASEIIARALVLNAMLNIYFEAPTSIILNWITANDLTDHLTQREKEILSKRNDELTEQELINLFWYIESLWALMWVGNLIEQMPFDRPVEDFMASLAPNLQKNEDRSRFSKMMRMREVDEIFRMLDLYFRLHWYASDGQLNGYSTEPVELSIVMERRKALEWVLSNQGWDEVDLST
ncbi:MAG: DUF4272 domain-containing protein [Cyanobacteria bacterium]|nr:DUF4272 domain-containing protein [Cyanobacteriota bacterium]